jgi:hypothetical protein
MYGEELWPWKTWMRRFIAFLFLLAAVCLTVLPLWQNMGVQPALFLIILYHWSVYRSDLLSVEQLVLISLIQDGVYAYPLGFSALRILICYALLITQKRILSHQRFLWVWGGFSVFALFDILVYAILLSCVKHEWTGFLPLMPGMLMTIGLYPLVVRMMNRFMVKCFPA